MPRLGPSISLRQASSLTTPYTQGQLVKVHAMVRILQALSTMYPNQSGDSLDGSMKSFFILAARLFLPSVITLRWSGVRRHRSAVGPRPLVINPVVIITAF